MSGKKIGIFLIIGIFIMISVVGVECVFAQKGSEIPAKQNVAGSEVEGASQSADDVMMSDGGEVSLDFREADIRNVLKILAFKSGINIVTSPEVVGVVTIQLKDVPWKQALEVILQTYGYAYDQKGNIIVVTTIEDMKKRREDSLLLAEQEPLETEIFMLNFGRASEIVESLEKMKSVSGLNIIGPSTLNQRAPIFSFTIEGVHPHDVVEKGRIFPTRMPLYFTFADQLFLFWSDRFDEKERLAATFSQEGIKISDQEAYDKFIAKYERDRLPLKEEEKLELPTWEALVASWMQRTKKSKDPFHNRDR